MSLAHSQTRRNPLRWALPILFGTIGFMLAVLAFDAIMPLGSGPISRFQYTPEQAAEITMREVVYSRLVTYMIICPKQNEWGTTTQADKQLWRLALRDRGFKVFGTDEMGCYVRGS